MSSKNKKKKGLTIRRRIETNEVKLVVVGDGAVGKTCMLVTYRTKQFPEEYVPTVFDNTQTQTLVDGKEYTLHLWDTAGQESFERLRPLSYLDADVFLICFDITRYDSFENVEALWLPELNHHAQGIPFILVGLKIDLRDDEDAVQALHNKGHRLLTKKDGENLAKELYAVKYMECSALTSQNLNEVFDEAIRAAVAIPKYKESACVLL